MRLVELGFDHCSARLASAKGLDLKAGPFTLNIQSKIPSVAEGLFVMYGNNLLADADEFVDHHVTIEQPAGLRRYLKPQVQFFFDGVAPFRPLPLVQAYPMLEWGLNLCVSSTANQYLIIHAAVVEKNGFAVVLPAPSGSGKSTLCATLVNSGWRLLSDELTLISLSSKLIDPLVRPVSLKNQSIDIIQSAFPQAVFTRVTRDTAKGTVAHMQAPASSVERATESVPLRYVVFPQYVAGSDVEVVPISRGHAFMRLIDNAFNYSLLGTEGFKLLSRVLRDSESMEFRYSRLDDAVRFFDGLGGRS